MSEQVLSLPSRHVTTATILGPGLLLVAVIGAIATAIEALERLAVGQPVIEALVAAILVGILVRNLVPLPKQVDAGATFATKTLLETGVLLLGATIDVRQVLAAGPVLLVAIAIAVVGGIAVSYSLGRLVGLHAKLAVLVAVGNSICGNSAIAAVAPVIRADKKDIASSVALTAIIGVMLVLGLPLLVPLIHLTNYQYGVLAGLTVYSVPQVIAASFPVSQISGQVATLVKLTRVLFLGPVVLGFGLAQRRGNADAVSGKRPPLIPWFIAGFVTLAALRFVGLLSAPVALAVSQGSHWLMILAMAGLGLSVEVAAIHRVGPRVAVAVGGSITFLITLSLLLILRLHVAG